MFFLKKSTSPKLVSSTRVKWTQLVSACWEKYYMMTDTMPTHEVRIVPHHRQRYNTIGDYYFDIYGVLIISVSKMKDLRFSLLVRKHELTEALACLQDGVKQSAIDKFDLNWEPTPQYDEPGADPRAPYHRQHLKAEQVERALAKEWGVDWDEYDREDKRLREYGEKIGMRG